MAVFGLAHAKEDPINLFIQPGYFVSPETLEALKAKWGLDKPLVMQYLTWAGNMLRGDLGDSVQQQRPVTKIIGDLSPHASIIEGTALAKPSGPTRQTDGFLVILVCPSAKWPAICS